MYPIHLCPCWLDFSLGVSLVVPKTIGLIAGSGRLPLRFAQRARQEGFQLVTVAVKGSASQVLKKWSREILWISSGQLGALISFFKKNKVSRTVLLGKVEHSGSFRDFRLDWRALTIWAKLKDRSGEALLKAVASELAKNGTKVLDSRFLMGDLLAEKGWWVKGKAGAEIQAEIRYGLGMARSLARKRVGQTILVKKQAVVAVEGMEGTDRAIHRAGKLAGPGTILVKVSSPRQDWRFDIPVIGVRTIRALAKAGARGLVVEAEKVFVLDRDLVIAAAKKNGLFILAV